MKFNLFEFYHPVRIQSIQKTFFHQSTFDKKEETFMNSTENKSNLVQKISTINQSQRIAVPPSSFFHKFKQQE